MDCLEMHELPLGSPPPLEGQHTATLVFPVQSPTMPSHSCGEG